MEELTAAPAAAKDEISSESEGKDEEKDEGKEESNAEKVTITPAADETKKSIKSLDDVPDEPMIHVSIPETKEGIRPRSRSRTSDPKLGVDLAMGKGKLQDLEPLTVGQLFKQTVGYLPTRPALKYKVKGEWNTINYTEYYNMVIKAAKSFVKLGVQEYTGVCIIGFNSFEWVIANLGAMFAGALPAGMYTTNSPEACYYVANSCKASVIVVENQNQLEKILEIRDRLPHLKTIIQYKGEVSGNHENVYNWKEFMKMGDDIKTTVIENLISDQQPYQCALLIYTSGTTGNPKAVMLSHDNLTWTANCLREAYGKLEFGCEHIVSYLPLSHMAAQMADIYLTLTIGGTVHFAEPDALKGSLVETLREAQPTIFFGVPRVYEKFMEAIQVKASRVKGLRRKVGKWATKKGIKGNYRRQSSCSLPMGWNFADRFVFKKVKEALGFQRCKIYVVGSAPTRQDVHEFFMSYNMPLMELYGMSESSGPQTFNVDTGEGKWRTGSCGPLLPGAHLKIHNPNNHGEGEICYYGRHVFMGYLNEEEKTREAIDDEGWLHSGDIGKVDEDGFLYVTGRIKELIITSGGENIAPAPIENRIKSEVPFLSNVFVIGDKRKFLSCVVTLITETDSDGQPSDTLAPMTRYHLEILGSQNTTVSGVRDPKDIAVYDAIQEGIKRANLNAISNAQRIQKFAILPLDFSIAGGELGPTMKVRRNYVEQKYADIIDGMYTVTYLYAVVKKEKKDDE